MCFTETCVGMRAAEVSVSAQGYQLHVLGLSVNVTELFLASRMRSEG